LLARGQLIALLRSLTPSLLVDATSRTISLKSPHEHDVDVAERGSMTFTPSHYVWPHVRITCDPPWPLCLTYPVAPLQPTRWRRPEVQDLLAPLRALGADARLQILALLLRAPRSTQELAGLLSLSPAAVSSHLAHLRRAELVTSRREGYYVVYSANTQRLHELGCALTELAGI
jgi:DNA-binding transcriptional ArsR family regulator